MTQSHAKSCVLNEKCTLRETEKCNRLCPHWIAMHGASGIGGRIGAAGVPRDYRLVTVRTSPVRDAQPSAYRLVEQYVASFSRMFDADSKRIKSLYLFSESPGTGKTTTAVAILNEWMTVHYIGALQRGIQPLPRPAFFLDVNAWQTLYNEFNRPRVPESIAGPAAERYYQTQKIAMSVPFLVMDDIGVRDATDGFRADLHAIINARVTNHLPTVYTSNVPMTELKEIYDARLADRVRDLCVNVPFDGESKRGRRR